MGPVFPNVLLSFCSFGRDVQGVDIGTASAAGSMNEFFRCGFTVS